MIRVNELVKFLKAFPSDANVHAYEGEVSGIIITSKNGRHELGIAHNNGTLEKFTKKHT